jgi:hypothetical protein
MHIMARRKAPKRTTRSYYSGPRVSSEVFLLRDKFLYTESFTMPNGKVVTKGDIIKITGVWGTKFKFVQHTINKHNGAEWFDCVELHNGQVGQTHSYRTDRIKLMPKKRGPRKKKPVEV